MTRELLAGALLVLATVVAGAPSDARETAPPASSTSAPLERSPDVQKQEQPPPETMPLPQLPQLPFPFPFSPFRPESASQPSGVSFPFPFLFPSLTVRPSAAARATDSAFSPPAPLIPLNDEIFFFSSEEDNMEEDPEMELRRASPTSDKKKQPKRKKKKAKKPKSPKPIVIYQKDDQVAVEGTPGSQSVLAGQLANGNQGSYLGYYMVYLVQVTWNGTNETQTVIAGRPIIPGRPVSAESAQITDLSGSSVTESPYRPQTLPAATQCLFQRSTTPFGGIFAGTTGRTTTTDTQQEIVSEEMDIGGGGDGGSGESAEYDDEDDNDDMNDSNPKNKNKKRKKKKTNMQMMTDEVTRRTDTAPSTSTLATATGTTT